MPGLLLKRLPDDLHRRLKARAAAHRRSMAKEALVILEQGVSAAPPAPLPPPVRGRFPLTQRWLTQAIRRGRA